MFRVLIVISIVIAFIMCGAKKDGQPVSETSNDSNSQSPSPTPVMLQDGDPIIKFETNGVWCNFCASVKISIFPDRKVTIEREEFVENKSVSGQSYIKKPTVENKRISESQLAHLVGKFEDMKFFELSDKYIPETDSMNRYIPTVTCPQSLSDGPTYHIYYRKNDQSKTVHHYLSCEADANSKKLPDLEETFDRMFNIFISLKKSFLANVNK